MSEEFFEVKLWSLLIDKAPCLNPWFTANHIADSEKLFHPYKKFREPTQTSAESDFTDFRCCFHATEFGGFQIFISPVFQETAEEELGNRPELCFNVRDLFMSWYWFRENMSSSSGLVQDFNRDVQTAEGEYIYVYLNEIMCKDGGCIDWCNSHQVSVNHHTITTIIQCTCNK